jgi:hypothetical protein
MQYLPRNRARRLRHYPNARGHRMRPSAAHPHAPTAAHNLKATVEIVCRFGQRRTAYFAQSWPRHGSGAGGGTRTPTGIAALRIFLPATAFAALALPHAGGFVVWTIPSPCSGQARRALLEGRCCPSSLYTFPIRDGPRVGDPSRAWLGIAMEQGFPEFGQFCIRGFPRSTQVVSQVRCVYRFRHARVTRPLYRPAPCLGRRAA